MMRKITAILVGGLLAAGAATAHAGVSVDINVNSRPRPVYVGPAYGVTDIGTRYDRVWVPPVTQTVTQTVWHDAVTEDRVDHTWLPDRYEVRDVPVTDSYGRTAVVRQSVLVEPGHWQDVHTPVAVRAGYYGPEAQTVVVQPGYWQTVERPVVVQQYYGPVGPVVVAPPYRDDGFHGHYDNYRHDYGDRGGPDHGGSDRGDRYRH